MGNLPESTNRLHVCASPKERRHGEQQAKLGFLWVADFPLLQRDARDFPGKWGAGTFTRPKAEDLSLIEEKALWRSSRRSRDVVLNGVEIGGGSIRIHERDLQAKMFEVLQS